MRRRLVVYTVLTGTKEPLGSPLSSLPAEASSDLELSFVCFTDNPALRSEVWEMRNIGQHALPAEKLSRRPKAMPHEYLPEWDFSLYVDNITVFKRLPQAADLATGAPYLFKAFKHSGRANPLQEGEAIVQLGYESADSVCDQLDYYARLFPLESIAPLSTCTMLLREHGHPAVAAFGLCWWEQILTFGRRDQMSFDFALKWTKAQLEHLPGQKNDNDLFENSPNIAPTRLTASFDAVRYAWLHRDDPAAVKDPRGHCLAHRATDGADYGRRSDLLEFVCYRAGSSLGTRVAPRRGIADALQDLLQAERANGGRLLMVHMQAEGPTAYTADELARAEQVLMLYLPRRQGVRLELQARQLETERLSFNDGERYALALFIGLPGPLLVRAHAMVSGSLAPGASLFALCSSPARAADVAIVEKAMDAAGPVKVSIQASWHDSIAQALPNSFVAFQQAK